MEMNRHISGQYDLELQTLHKHFLDMAGLVESQLRDAWQSYLNKNIQIAQQVIEREQQVNQYEIDIDVRVPDVIARRQPIAGDMRNLIALAKSTTDLERIGDESKRIAKLAMNHRPDSVVPAIHRNLLQLGELVHTNLQQALDAFARLDEPLALTVKSTDQDVDDLYNQIIDQCSEQLAQESTKVDEYLTTIWTVRALERIGDHAKNIGENVVYAVSGRYIKHNKNKAKNNA